MMSFDMFWLIQEYCLSAVFIILTVTCTAYAVKAMAGTYYMIVFNHRKKKRLEEEAEQKWEYVDWEDDKSKDA